MYYIIVTSLVPTKTKQRETKSTDFNIANVAGRLTGDTTMN